MVGCASSGPNPRVVLLPFNNGTNSDATSEIRRLMYEEMKKKQYNLVLMNTIYATVRTASPNQRRLFCKEMALNNIFAERLWRTIFSANHMFLYDPADLATGQKIIIPPSN